MQVGVIKPVLDGAFFIIFFNDIIHELHGFIVFVIQLLGITIAVQIGFKGIFIALDSILEPAGKAAGLGTQCFTVGILVFFQFLFGILAQGNAFILCQLFNGTILLYLVQAAFLNAGKNLLICHGAHIHAKGIFIIHHIVDNVCCQLTGVYLFPINGCYHRCIVLLGAAGHGNQHADTEQSGQQHGNKSLHV